MIPGSIFLLSPLSLQHAQCCLAHIPCPFHADVSAHVPKTSTTATALHLLPKPLKPCRHCPQPLPADYLAIARKCSYCCHCYR